MAKRKYAQKDLLQQFIDKNRLVINKLLDFILDVAPQRQRFGKCVVGISGAGCLGKSTLAQAIARCLQDEYNITPAVIDLDGFLIEKAIRERGPIPRSGYHPEGYELQVAQATLKKLIEYEEPIEVKEYDKVSSLRVNSHIVQPAQLVIIEGACTFFDKLRDFLNIKIFVEASKEVQFKNRLRREMFEMGRIWEQIVVKFKGLYPDYLTYIKPTKTLAEVILSVDSHYRFYIEKIIQVEHKTSRIYTFIEKWSTALHITQSLRR